MNATVTKVGVGFLVGVLSGLLGVGGGVFLVPIMVAWFGYTQHLAQGTSLAVVIPTGLVSGIVYSCHGQADLTITVQMLIGSMVGASVGARIMQRMPAEQLKRLFGVLLVLVGIRMVLT